MNDAFSAAAMLRKNRNKGLSLFSRTNIKNQNHGLYGHAGNNRDKQTFAHIHTHIQLPPQE